MIKRNIGIVALIILLLVAFLDYDEGKKNKRSSIYNRALSIQDTLREEEELLEKIYYLKTRLDFMIAEFASYKEMNEEEQKIYNEAILRRDEVSTKLEKMESMSEKTINEYNILVEEYNRTTRPILLRKRELPLKMVRYLKPTLPNSAEPEKPTTD